jgi:predicted ChrR family anti-sigma factor
MTSPFDNQYAAFMLDYASGALSRGEALAASLHCALSRRGAVSARLFDAIGGRLLEGLDETRDMSGGAGTVALAPSRTRPERDLSPYLDQDLLALKWRRNMFGMQSRPTEEPSVTLMRLDPGQRAPGHGHGRRDVTVVLQGSYADEYGVYKRGDIAFAEPGMRHQPRAIGDAPCVCLIAEEPVTLWQGLKSSLPRIAF